MASRKKQNEDPVEGSRETIERELEKEEHSRTEPPDRTTDDDEGRIRARAYEIWEREGGLMGAMSGIGTKLKKSFKMKDEFCHIGRNSTACRDELLASIKKT